MTILDDLKAINKDIRKPNDYDKQRNRAEYWKIKLENIYPDYKFFIIGTFDFNIKLIASIKSVDEVY